MEGIKQRHSSLTRVTGYKKDADQQRKKKKKGERGNKKYTYG